jgi:succinyl-diaminopimelate desuccinylase
MTAMSTIPSLVEEQAETILGLAADLVAIPSENPPGDVDAVFAYAARRLEEFGFAPERVSPAPGRHNLVATIETGRPGPHVVLNAHLDTFPVGDATAWTRPPFEGAVEDGTLHGRGASDMKGGAAAFMAVLRVLDGVRDDLVGRVSLTLVCDEETFGPHGARHLLDARPDLAGDVLLSTEPSSPGVVRYAEKGMAWGECTFRGPGGHAAYPSDEPTAIESAAAFVLALRGFEEDAGPPGATHPAERVVANAGVIAGGTSVNMRADLCTVRVDVRVPLGLSTADMIERVRALAAEHGADYRVWNRFEPNASDRDHPIFALLCDHAERVTGTRPAVACGLGCTDARLWRARGIPAAVYGPSPTGMAAPDEALARSELLDVVRVHALAVCDYLARDE